MPYDIGGGLIPSGENMLKEAQTQKLKAEAAEINDRVGRENLRRQNAPVVPSPGPQNDKFNPILPQQTAQTNKLNAETDLINTQRRGLPGYKNGGPVTGKYTKGTGAVNIGDWVAPMKSRGSK